MLHSLHIQYQLFTQWLHIHHHFAGIAAFCISFTESLAVIGSIVPGSVTMTAIGILIGSNIIPVYTIFAWAIFGAICGDSISYFIGFYLKEGTSCVWPFNKHPKIIQTGKNFFEKHGGKSIFIGRFAGPVRAIVPIIAGIMHMPPRRYYIASIPAAILWAPIYMLPGILVGAASLEMPPKLAAASIVFLMLVLVCTWIIVKTTVYLYEKTHLYFAKILDNRWQIWKKHLSKKWLCYLLHHAGRSEKRGQLLLATTSSIALILFLLLFCGVIFKNSTLINWDVICYHLSKILRTASVYKASIVLSIFCYEKILILLLFTLTILFLIKKK